MKKEERYKLYFYYRPFSVINNRTFTAKQCCLLSLPGPRINTNRFNAIHVSFPSHDCYLTHARRMRDWRLFIRYSKNQSYRKLDKIGHKLLPTYLLTSKLCIVSWRYSYETRLRIENKNISSLWRRSSLPTPLDFRFPSPAIPPRLDFFEGASITV